MKLYRRAIDFVNKFTITLSKIKDLYKNCRSYEVTQLCRWKLLHLNLFSGTKLDLKIIFAECLCLALGKVSFAQRHVCGTRQIVCLLCAKLFVMCFLVGTPKFCTRQIKRHTANTRFPLVAWSIVARCIGANNIPNSLSQFWRWCQIWFPAKPQLHDLVSC